MNQVHVSQHDRRTIARVAQDRQVSRQWTVVVLVVAVVIVSALSFTLTRRYLYAVEVGILRERSEKILQAMRDHQALPVYNHSADMVYAPPSWTLTAVDAIESRGRVLATIDHPNSGGKPDTVVWELRFVENASTGWTCTSIIAVDSWFDDEDWRR